MRGKAGLVTHPDALRGDKGIVDIASQLENGGVEAIEVFVRGEKLTEPRLVYSKVLDNNIYTNPHMLTADYEPVIVDYKTDKYPFVKDAINGARMRGIDKVVSSIPNRIEALLPYLQPKDRAYEFIYEIDALAAQTRRDIEVGKKVESQNYSE